MMAASRLVSVIVPIYNSAEYLQKCVGSLLDQSYQNVEVILVDDGSSDRSGIICDSYAERDSRIRVFHKQNGGVSSARNMGIDYASGDFLIFVDSDDIVHRELIQIYMQALEKDELLLCGTASEMLQLEPSYQNVWMERTKVFTRDKFMDLLYKDHFNMPWNKLYDAEIIRAHKLRFREDKNLGEDFLFNLEYFQYCPQTYKVIQYPLYYYQEGREGSLGNSYRSDLFELQKELFEKLLFFLNECGVWNEYNQKLYYQLYWDRLYMTIHIYETYMKSTHDRDVKEKLQTYLKDPVWKMLERECGCRGLMRGKRRAKKICMMLREKIW